MWVESKIMRLGHAPPFFKADSPIIIGVYFCEEVIEIAAGDRETSATQSSPQFGFRDFTVVIVIDTSEECKEFFFGLLNECAKFWDDVSRIGPSWCVMIGRRTVIRYAPIAICVYSSHHLVQELIRIFQSYSILLANDVCTACRVLR